MKRNYGSRDEDEDSALDVEADMCASTAGEGLEGAGAVGEGLQKRVCVPGKALCLPKVLAILEE